MFDPPRPKGFLFPLRIEVSEGAYVVGTPRRNYVIRGLIAALALPPLFFLLGLIIFAGVIDHPTRDAEIAFTAGAGTLSFMAVVLGGGMMALSGMLARRTQVRFDRARRVVRHTKVATRGGQQKRSASSQQFFRFS